MTQPNFNTIREHTAIEGLRLLLVQALYGKDDPTINWSQLITCAENLRKGSQEKDALLDRLKGAIQEIREQFEDLQGGCNHCGSYEGHIEGCFLFYACEVLNGGPA
jgi:hypothetical protein